MKRINIYDKAGRAFLNIIGTPYLRRRNAINGNLVRMNFYEENTEIMDFCHSIRLDVRERAEQLIKL